MSRKITTSCLICCFLFAFAPRVFAQALGLGSPSQVVKQFYDLLRAKQYADGLRLSVYRPAIEGLTADELKELEPEFMRIAASLPEQVAVQGEQISGDSATVFVRMPDKDKAQPITLMKVEGRWIIGDRETQKYIKTQGHNYFFEEKMRVSEAEVKDWMLEILGAELVYFQKFQRYATLDELIKLNGVSAQFASGIINGYQFDMKIGDGGKTFTVRAVPMKYGRTGKLSFFADQSNDVKAEDNAGKPIGPDAPSYRATN